MDFSDIAFPSSPYVAIYIPISFIIIVIQLQILGLVLYRANQLKNSSYFTSQIFLSFGLYILGYLLGFISVSLERFLDWQLVPFWSNEYFYQQGWYLFALAGFGSCVILERNFRAISKRPYVLSVVLLFLIFMSLVNYQSSFLSLLLFLAVNLCVLYFWIRLWRVISAETNRYVFEIVIGLVLGLANLFFINQILESTITAEIVFIFLYLFQLTGHFILFHGFLHIKTLNDGDWRSAILELYLISRQGRDSVFYHNFKNPGDFSRKRVATSVLAIEDLMRLIDTDIKDSSDIESIEKGENSYIIRSTPQLIAVLSVSKYFRIYENLLVKILRVFSYQYQYIINRHNLTENRGLFQREFVAKLYDLVYK